jgi:hypothetical protein
MVDHGQGIDWALIPGPPEYRPNEVAVALRAVLAPQASDWTDAATMMRFAAGNDHRGTIYPAAARATEVLLEIAATEPGQACRTALAVLLDWWCFDPEPGYEHYIDATGEQVDLVDAIQRAVLATTVQLQQMAADPRDPVSARMAAELMACAHHGWGTWIGPDGTIHHRNNE